MRRYSAPSFNGRSWPILLSTLAAGVVVASASGGFAPLAGVLVVLALAALITRRRGALRGTDLTLLPIVRVGGCSLGPNASVHALRCGNQVLIVGATTSAVTLLESRPASTLDATSEPELVQDVDECRRLEKQSFWSSRHFAPSVLTGLVLATVLATSSVSALGAQTESATQRVDLDGTPSTTGKIESREPQGELESIPQLGLETSLEGPPAGAGPFVWLGALALLPFLVMSATSFVKISVVLSLLRNALGTPQVPSDPVLAAIALALTGFVMTPVADEVVARVAARGDDLSTARGALGAFHEAQEPIRGFLQRNARPEEIALFVEISRRDTAPPAEPSSFAVLLPSFITTELREAFVVGFLVFLPFLVVDMVVANILMSMGMVMVSPASVALPFKLMLFVLVDGWPLLMKGLALGYS